MAVPGMLTEEATGIWKGVLLEDMILTVQKVMKPYIDVLIPELFEDYVPHPLTYVPVWFQTLPLKMGDEVWVQYNQGSTRYPVLYKPAMLMDETMISPQVDIPQDEGFPAPMPTTNIFSLGNLYYLVVTEGYATLLKGQQAIILSDSGVCIKAVSKSESYDGALTIKVTGDTGIEGMGAVSIKSAVEVVINDHLKVLP
jgi:hypothetical protein